MTETPATPDAVAERTAWAAAALDDFLDRADEMLAAIRRSDDGVARQNAMASVNPADLDGLKDALEDAYLACDAARTARFYAATPDAVATPETT